MIKKRNIFTGKNVQDSPFFCTRLYLIFARNGGTFIRSIPSKNFYFIRNLLNNLPSSFFKNSIHINDDT
jgi:hypothetical protein